MAERVYLAVVLAAALYLFWSQRLRSDVTAVLVMLSLMVPWPRASGEWRGVLGYEQAFAGFGSSALIMIAAMFVIGGAVVQTGAAEFALRALRRTADREWSLQLAILALATLTSMFINDTTVVLILLPLILAVCRERDLLPSRHLMFAAYGSLLGGQWTLIGTRSNVILSDFLRQHGGEGIGFFAFAALGAPIFAVCAVLLLVVGRKVLPRRRATFSGRRMREFLTELTVRPGSKATGQRVAASNPGLTPLALVRNKRRLPASVPLEPGDVVVVAGTVDAIGSLWKSPDFELRDEALTAEDFESIDLVTVEAVVPRSSYYIGQRVGDIPFERNYGVTVLGVAHRDRPTAAPLAPRLEPGDSLLLLGGARDVDRLRHHTGLLLLDARSLSVADKSKAWLMLGLLAGVVLCSATGWLPPPVAMSLAGAAAVLLGAITLRAAYEAIDWPTLVTLGAIISFGIALEETGSARAIAELAVRNLSGAEPVIVLAALLSMAVLLTQVVENAAVAIIVAPIAFEVATALGLDPMPIMVALGVCVSASFATPIAHESTILVMGPGHYLFRHYLLIGSGLALATWLVASLLTPMIWRL